MRFHTFVLKNVFRRPVRSLLTVLGMAVAVGAVVSLVGISRGFESSFLGIYQRRNVDLVVQQAGAKQRLTSALDESLAERIAAIPGVRRVNKGLVDMMSLEELGAVGVLVQGWPPDAAPFDELKILSGDRLHQGDHRKIMLGRVLAANLGKRVGDKVTMFENESFEVQGIYEAFGVFENGGLIMLLEDLQRFMGREGQVNGFTVGLQHPGDAEEMERVRNRIESLAKNLAATPMRDFVRSTTELQLVQAMAWITSAVALVIGSVGVLNTMIMSVFERTSEIGILRAIGWARGRILRMILMESVVLSLSGGAVGVVVAMLLTQVLSRMPAVAGMIDNRIPPSVVLEGFVLALLVGLLGAAYPAYRGSRLVPTEAIRHE